MGVLRTAYVNVLPKTDEFDPELKKRLRRIDARREGDRVGGTFSSGFSVRMKALGGVARVAIAGVGAAAIGAAGGVVAFGLRTAASLEQAQIGFETLLGSAKSARGFLGDLKSFAASTPFELPGLIESSRTLLGVGLDAKQVIPTLRAFGDAAGAVGVGQEQFKRIMLATSQAISAGKFQTEDLNQIMENGIPIWTILSKAMNKPVPELRKLATEGKLLSSDVLPLLEKQMGKDYGGAMARQSQTLAGVWSTLKDTVAIGLADAIQPLVPLLTAAVPRAAAVAGQALKTFSLGFRGLVEAAKGEGITSDGFVGVMERIGVAARAAFDFFRAEVLPRLREFAAFVVGTVIPALAGLVTWLNRNRDVVVAFAAVFAAVKLTLFVQGVLKTIAAIRTWIVLQGGLNAVLFANPIGLVVLAIAALVAGLILAYRHSETFRTIVQAAWKGIQAAVSYAWNNVIKPTVAALVAFFRNVIAPTAMWLWNNVFKPAFAGIGWAVHAAWVVIQIALAAFRLLLVNVIFPIIRFFWNNVVKPVFGGIATTISTVWNKGIKPIFSALGSFISKNVAPAFRTGVDAIAAAWNKVKEAAAAPVRFIVDTVINKGIIGAINWLADKVGVKDRIAPLRWSSSGGGSRPGDRISGNIRGDGYGVGDGKGTGDGFGSLLAGPAKWLSNRIGLGALVSKFGNNPFVHALMGAGNRLKGMALDKIESLIGELGGGGSVGAGGLRSGILGVLGSLRSMFGQVGLISGFRRGARTLSGALSYHALGRAIDIAPIHQWAAFLNATFGSRLRELITPWNDLNIHNGQPHRYTGDIWNQHNFAGGNAHIHAAMANGGVIREPVFGIGSSGRTYSFGERGPETVTPGVGGNTYHINVAVPVGAHPAQTGAEIIKVIQAWEQANGRRWRE